jgi:hypothetical protein
MRSRITFQAGQLFCSRGIRVCSAQLLLLSKRYRRRQRRRDSRAIRAHKPRTRIGSCVGAGLSPSSSIRVACVLGVLDVLLFITCPVFLLLEGRVATRRSRPWFALKMVADEYSNNDIGDYGSRQCDSEPVPGFRIDVSLVQNTAKGSRPGPPFSEARSRWPCARLTRARTLHDYPSD